MVPPNTSEFYVSYIPQTRTNPNFNNHMANGNYYNNSGGGNYNNTAMNQSNGMQNRSNPSNNGGNVGGYVLPLLGGAALGAAGLAMMSHYGHGQQQEGEQQQQQQQYYDDNGPDTGYDDAGDYGGFGDY
jgi:hypothetical protein